MAHFMALIKKQQIKKIDFALFRAFTVYSMVGGPSNSQAYIKKGRTPIQVFPALSVHRHCFGPPIGGFLSPDISWPGVFITTECF